MAVWRSGSTQVWWSRRTGRHARLADPVEATPALLARLARLDLIAGPPVDAARAYPTRSHLPLLRPDQGALWYPLPGQPLAGGHAWAARALSPAEQRAWRACDGRTPGAEVARRADLPLEAVEALMRWATDPSVQAGQWRTEPVARSDPSLARLIGGPRLPSKQPDGVWRPDGTTDLTAYHLAIADGPSHFDDVETTVAHAHAVPHPGLGGRTYGDALADALGWWPTAGLTLEIGPGDGELAQALCARAPPEHWIRLDLSPGLLAESQRRNPGSPGVLGDATHLPFGEATLARVVANEVIADLAATPRAAVDPRWLAAGLDERSGMYNTGSFALVAEIARVLVPGGRAFLSEFGGADGLADSPPEATVQLDHPEVSIQFGDLERVARAVGLDTRLERLDTLLGFDLSTRHLCRAHFEGLRAMHRAAGERLAARAWTPENLTLPWPVEGLVWCPISEPGPGPLVTRFWALLLEKPVAPR